MDDTATVATAVKRTAVCQALCAVGPSPPHLIVEETAGPSPTGAQPLRKARRTVGPVDEVRAQVCCPHRAACGPVGWGLWWPGRTAGVQEGCPGHTQELWWLPPCLHLPPFAASLPRKSSTLQTPTHPSNHGVEVPLLGQWLSPGFEGLPQLQGPQSRMFGSPEVLPPPWRQGVESVPSGALLSRLQPPMDAVSVGSPRSP